MTTDSDAWDLLLDDLERRRSDARAMGGPDRLERHRAVGAGDRLDARAAGRSVAWMA